ncbi:MAG: hypothetical protein ACI4V1_07820 [Eubacteriales bacterium]
MPIFGKNNNKEKENKNLPANDAPAAAPAAPAPEAPAAPAVPETPAAPEAAPAKKYETPEGFDFNRYFLAERRIVLENVSYETHPVQPSGTMKLAGKDTIVAQIVGQAGVKITYNRTLQFDPEGPFSLSVSFAVMLVFNPGTRSEIDWKTIDVANEFRKACPALVTTMMGRATLLVAEITSASGGAPIIPLK